MGDQAGLPSLGVLAGRVDTEAAAAIAAEEAVTAAAADSEAEVDLEEEAD